MAIKNSMIASGGVSRHVEPGAMREAAQRGTRFVTVAPQRDDLPPEAAAQWVPIRPGTDVAVMLAMAHTLLTEGLHDQAFLQRYTSGFEVFRSEEHTSELQSLMRISYAVFCLKKKKTTD